MDSLKEAAASAKALRSEGAGCLGAESETRRDGASSKHGGLIVMPTWGSSAGERGAVQCGVAVPLYDLGHMKAGAAAHSPQETPLIPVLSCCWCEHKGISLLPTCW